MSRPSGSRLNIAGWRHPSLDRPRDVSGIANNAKKCIGDSQFLECLLYHTYTQQRYQAENNYRTVHFNRPRPSPLSCPIKGVRFYFPRLSSHPSVFPVPIPWLYNEIFIGKNILHATFPTSLYASASDSSSLEFVRYTSSVIIIIIGQMSVSVVKATDKLHGVASCVNVSNQIKSGLFQATYGP